MLANPAASQPSQESEGESALVRRGLSDSKAFALLYRQHVGAVYHYCYRRLGNREASEDATQLVFERALKALPSYREESPFRPWLFAIAHNALVDLGRRHHTSLPLDQAYELFDPSPSPEDVAIRSDEGIWLRGLLASLPARERQLLELRLSGLNDREIADVLNMSHGAVRTMQYRAIQRLRKLAGIPSATGNVNVVV